MVVGATIALEAVVSATRRRRPPASMIGGLISFFRLLVLVTLAVALPARGQEIRVGEEFQINSYTIGYQVGPAVAVDDDGDFVVVWFDERENSYFRLAARQFSSTGEAQASEFTVNSVPLNLFTSAHSVASRSGGDFVVVWSRPEASGYGVFARLFSSAGNPTTGEFQINGSTIISSPILPVAASDAAGDFVVTWSRQGDSGLETIRARRFSSAGVALTDELHVNSNTEVWRPFPVVASDADGDFVVVWKRLTSIDFPSYYYHVVGRRFSSAGVASAEEFQVSTQTIRYPTEPFPAVASDAVGDFVVAWRSVTPGDYAAALLARRFASTAAPLTDVFEVNAHSTSAGNGPWVTSLPAGDFIVAWNAFDGSEGGVLARRFSSAGSPLAVEFQVNTFTPDGQSIFRSMAANAAGQFVVTWSSSDQDGSDWGVFGQRFALPTPTATLTSTATATPTVTPTPTATTTLTAPALYTIPTLSRFALVILMALLLGSSLAVLLSRKSD
jgi:hypothetical protein